MRDRTYYTSIRINDLRFFSLLLSFIFILNCGNVKNVKRYSKEIGIIWKEKLLQVKFVKNETEEIVKGLQEATQDENAEDDRYLDDGTSDIDILDANNYGIEKWYKQLLRIGGWNGNYIWISKKKRL